jgi:hypothetical protein
MSDVRDARSLSGGERDKMLESAASALEQVEGATVAPDDQGGLPAQIDNTHIIAGLREDDPNLAAIESSLSALSESLGDETPRPVAGTLAGTQAVAEMRDVLADPIFQVRESPLRRFARWLGGLTGDADPQGNLWRFFTSLVAALAAGALAFLASDRLGNRWLRLALAAVVGLIVGVVFFYFTGDFGLAFQVLAAVGLVVAAVAAALIFGGVRSSSVPARARPLSELAAALGMSAAEARKRAEEAAGAEDYRSAIRFRSLALLLALDEVGKLQFDRTATDREYLFRAPPSIHDDLQALLDRFEAVWYGSAPAGPDDWTAHAAQAAQVEARVAEEVRAEKQEAARGQRSAA